ncbi:MAG: alpha/beta fold hydrolase [Saprospirales bacterium]|nr:alpha/beta fold hydrolase [Saprospirales bacterium]MBK7338295.1 alpha/beta fold hydrolase [Saprospirales bacterium]
MVRAGMLLLLVCSYSHAQAPLQPSQPTQGPGGSEYPYEEIVFIDSAQTAGGYWICKPANPGPDSAAVVVFLHGFGCFNPMIYGQWIRHLARKGHVVLMPRYQDELWEPHRSDFTDTAAHAIQKALRYLEEQGDLKLKLDKPIFIGHSYGGVLAANLAIKYAELGIPKPAALMLCQPGTNFFPGGRLPDYRGLPDDLNLLILLSQNDQLVSRRFGKKVYRCASNVSKRDMLLMREDHRGRPPLAAGHRACHATDPAFDNGIRTFSARYALFHIPTDAADYYGFWKLGDALIDCTLRGAYCETAFGGTPSQLYLGTWSDGKPVKPFKRLVTSDW